MEPKTPEIDTLIGSAVFAFTKGLIAAGMTPTEALQRTAFAIIEGTLGRDVYRTLGVPRQTSARWRRDLAAAAENAPELDEREVFLEAANALLPALGLRDLRLVAGDDER